MGGRGDSVKFGLIAASGIAEDHIRGYRKFADRIGVTAVADSQADTLARRSAELGATAFADYGRLISEGDIDAVDICLPHYLHADAIVRAAENGKHVLCEKPLCLTADEAR